MENTDNIPDFDYMDNSFQDAVNEVLHLEELLEKVKGFHKTGITVQYDDIRDKDYIPAEFKGYAEVVMLNIDVNELPDDELFARIEADIDQELIKAKNHLQYEHEAFHDGQEAFYAIQAGEEYTQPAKYSLDILYADKLSQPIASDLYPIVKQIDNRINFVWSGHYEGADPMAFKIKNTTTDEDVDISDAVAEQLEKVILKNMAERKAINEKMLDNLRKYERRRIQQNLKEQESQKVVDIFTGEPK